VISRLDQQEKQSRGHRSRPRLYGSSKLQASGRLNTFRAAAANNHAVPNPRRDFDSVASPQARALVAVWGDDFDHALDDVEQFVIPVTADRIPIIRRIVPLVRTQPLFTHLSSDC